MPTLGDYSEVSICNMALGSIGRSLRIVSLTEPSEAARACLSRYPFARDAVLRSYDWNFAGARASLPADGTPPAFEYAAQYQLPGDCLLVREVYEGNAEDWKVEGRKILTNMGAPLPIKYTAKVTDPAAFDPLFVDALAARLGSDLAVQLTESTSRAEALWKIYREKLVEARRRDSQEGQPDSFPRDSWVDSRNTGISKPYSDWKG